MQFLGDAGGLHSSLLLIGYLVNYFLTGKDSSLQLLSEHFYVNTGDFEAAHPIRWFHKFTNEVTGLTDSLIFGTIFEKLSSFCPLSPRRKRLKRIIEDTEKHLEQALDIRTMLRMQSITLAIIRCLFTPDHYPLLSLQRKGDLLDIEEQVDAAEILLYGSDASIINKPQLASVWRAI